MSSEAANKEVQWHRWRLENEVKKLLKTLTKESVDSFGNEVQKRLSTHSSSQKLMSLPGSHGPVWPVLSCLLAEGVRRKGGEDKVVVVALRKLAGLLSVDVCQLLQPVVEEVASDVCEPSSSAQSMLHKHSFCSFIGKLFLDASYSHNRDYAVVMGRIVRHFLNAWSTYPADSHEEELLARVKCFGFLCQQIGPTIDVTNREILEQYFTGSVREHILNTHLPRSVCGYLLDLLVKRAGSWRKEKEKGVPEAPHSSVPLAFSQDTPTHSADGQEVVHPVPVEPQAAPHSYQPQPTAQTIAPPPPHVSIPQSIPLEQTVTSQPFYSHSQYQQNIPSGIPSGIESLQQTTPHYLSFSAVQEMLQSLSLTHHLDNFKRARISDSVMECANTDSLRGGLKDAGLHPGEVVSVLDYLEKGRMSCSQSTPSTLYTTPHHQVQPSPSTLYTAPHHQVQPSPYAAQYTSTVSQGTPHPTTLHLLPSYPTTPGTPHLPSHPATPGTPHLPSHPTTPPSHHPPPQYSPFSTSSPNHPPPPSPQYSPLPTNHPSTPTFPPSSQQSLTSPLPQFTPSYRAPVRLPTPIAPSNTSVGGVSGTGTGPGPNQKYGFGQFACVLCRRQDHGTEQCPDRHRLLFPIYYPAIPDTHFHQK